MIPNTIKRPRAVRAVLVVGAIGLAAACHTKRLERASDLDPLSPTLVPFVHYEEGKVLFLGVDGRAASYIKEGNIIPLGVGLANLSSSGLTFGRESFVLEDEDGNRYPVISYEEYQQDYRRSRTDERLAQQFVEALNARFAGSFTAFPWRLFPVSGSQAGVQAKIELGRRQYTRGYLYFPLPAEQVHGRRFSLLVNAAEVPETFLVRFELR